MIEVDEWNVRSSPLLMSMIADHGDGEVVKFFSGLPTSSSNLQQWFAKLEPLSHTVTVQDDCEANSIARSDALLNL